MHVLACAPISVPKLGSLLPSRFIEDLEQNQKIAACCRHPEHHTIEAWFSNEAERETGQPDIYIFRCTCGRQHRRFMLGSGLRPFWVVH